MSSLSNRLRKVFPTRLRWAERQGLTAFRVYDEDIPEYRYVIDVYGDHAHIVEYSRRGFFPKATQEKQREEVLLAVQQVLGAPPERIHLKTKEPKIWGRDQYEKRSTQGARLVVQENGLSFFVNLDDYLDTGLFLDHRNTREKIRAESAGKRFLNLFCYTGSFSVYAAAGGALSTTSVDLSSTYLAWAQDNLKKNGLFGPAHELIRSDVTRWLFQVANQPGERKKASVPPPRYDLAVLDPPSFSASKKMESTFDVQRDHIDLIRGTIALLAPGGVLYFSTNFRQFSLDTAALSRLAIQQVEELTPKSIPEDIRNKRVHRCFRIRR